jgi:DNA-binding beta-propeller fold protein YncE
LTAARTGAWRSSWAATVAAWLLVGCAASGGPAVLHFGMEDAPEGRRIVWPQPPEVPRYLYAGQLVGELNFRRPGAEGAAAGARLFRWVVGLDSEEANRSVLQRPLTGMVDAAGRIYVTDMSRRAVYVFDERAGELLVWEHAAGLASFISPAGIAEGRAGEVLVADADLAMVVRLDATGRPVGAIGKGVLKRPTGIARDATSGRIYVADTHAHAILVFDDAGTQVDTIGRRGEGDGELNFPTHLALAKGELFVTDTMNNRVQVFGTDGRFRRRFGASGLYLGNLVRPKGVAVDNEGHVYVVESYYDHLLVFGPGGEFLLPIGGTGTETGRFYLPAGVWTDSRNRVFVADMYNGRVVIFQFLGGG